MFAWPTVSETLKMFGDSASNLRDRIWLHVFSQKKWSNVVFHWSRLFLYCSYYCLTNDEQWRLNRNVPGIETKMEKFCIFLIGIYFDNWFYELASVKNDAAWYQVKALSRSIIRGYAQQNKYNKYEFVKWFRSCFLRSKINILYMFRR